MRRRDFLKLGLATVYFPFVRKSPLQGELILLDGHHRMKALAVISYRQPLKRR